MVTEGKTKHNTGKDINRIKKIYNDVFPNGPLPSYTTYTSSFKAF